ncbi:MAG: radical SAM protein [Lachnospiraceae bacterium]|nr:radical SAM protein [Lachnospiraceae bacterium]
MNRYNKLILVRTLEQKFPFYKKLTFGMYKRILTLFLSPFALCRFIKARKSFFMPYAEIALTERCSLRCLNCANLMPYYDSPQHNPFENIIKDVEALEKVVCELSICQLLGGEPFIYPQIKEVLDLLNAKAFIKHIQIVTNGTVLPPENITEQLKNKKVTVHISDYGDKSFRLHELITLFDKEGICFEIIGYSNWIDYGDLSDKGFTDEEIKQSYKTCATAECKTLFKGYLYTCPRSAHMANLGILVNNADRISIDGHLTKQKLIDFYNKVMVSACGHCELTKRRKQIPPAFQCVKEN